MLWVTDTGPVLHLAEARALDLLPMLGEVVMPPAVSDELAQLRRTVTLPSLLHVRSLDERRAAEAADWCQAGLVDRGEAQAIALARQIGADILLTDDAAARLLATSVGVQARGSLGIVLWLAGQRRVGASEASRHLENLVQSSLWVSPRIVAEARGALKKITDS